MSGRPNAKTFHQSRAWDEANGGVAVSDLLLGPHEVEQNIWRELQLASGGNFSSLIVRRLENGVCLQGVLETTDGCCPGDVDSLVKRVARVDRVLNQIVVREARAN